MFAYCGSGPIGRYDIKGESWVVVAAGATAALISGVSNALNVANNGGTLEECLLAGVVGGLAGAAGFCIASMCGFSTLGNLAGRATTTLISDLGTNLVLNGEVTQDDFYMALIDATFDVSFSTVTYYYNPVEDLVSQTAINALVDGLIDYGEAEILYNRIQSAAELRRIQRLTFMERRLNPQ